MKEEPYPVSEMKKTLKRLEAEAAQLKSLSEGMPGVERNIEPIMAFIDILKFHLDDRTDG